MRPRRQGRLQVHRQFRHLQCLHLRKHGAPIATPFSLLLEAGVAQVRGDEAKSQTLLAEAASRLDEMDTNLLAAAARWRLHEQRDEAQAWFDREGVRDPVKLVNLLVPGWRE